MLNFHNPAEELYLEFIEEGSVGNIPMTSIRDLTALALADRLEPAVGRDGETTSLLEILCRRGRRHALLIGEAGIGKRAIVRRTVQRTLAEPMPSGVRNRKFVELHLDVLPATSADYLRLSVQIQAALSKCVREKSIVVLNDLNPWLAAKTASFPLYRAIEQELIQCVALANDNSEWERACRCGLFPTKLFAPVAVHGVTRSDALTILESHRDAYEAYHDVHVADAALWAIVEAVGKSSASRISPSSLIELLDRACATVRMAECKGSASTEGNLPINVDLEALMKAQQTAFAAGDYEKACRLLAEVRKLREQPNAPTPPPAPSGKSPPRVDERIVRQLMG